MALMQQYEDPLKRIAPKIGAPVQNLGGMQPNTAPIANRPVAPPAVRTATPGPAEISLPPMPAGPVAAPAPAAPPPAAVAPPVAPAPPSADLYGKFGGTSAQSSSLEDQLRGYITQGLGGVTSKGFIDRAKNQLGSAIGGQQKQATNRINEDSIRRGLFKSGIPAESIAATETGARGALSSGISDILGRAEQQDIAGRESAAGTAGNLLGMNRSWDQYSQQRSDEQAARAAANRKEDTGFTYVDPDTGQEYQMDESWF